MKIQNLKFEDEDENPARKIVAWPRPDIVASEEPKGTPFHIQNMPNYITQDDLPAENTRSKTRKQEIILRMSDEGMLSCIQMTKQATVNLRAAAFRKYPMQLLCELAAPFWIRTLEAIGMQKPPEASKT